MPDTVSFSRPLDIDTPVGALSRLNIGEYDRIITDFRKKSAEKEAVVALALQKTDELCENMTKLLSDIPAIEAIGIADELMRLALLYRVLNDGFVPRDAEKLLAEFTDKRNKVRTISKDVSKKLGGFCQSIQRLDAKRGARLSPLLAALETHLKRFLTHYQTMVARSKNLLGRIKSPPVGGPVRQSVEIYKEALSSMAGVREIGELHADLRHNPPIYELPVSLDPSMFNDRRQLRELEHAVDEYVDERDPKSVGLIIFRFGQIRGAA
jgi:hypothetical protein